MTTRTTLPAPPRISTGDRILLISSMIAVDATPDEWHRVDAFIDRVLAAAGQPS